MKSTIVLFSFTFRKFFASNHSTGRYEVPYPLSAGFILHRRQRLIRALELEYCVRMSLAHLVLCLSPGHTDRFGASNSRRAACTCEHESSTFFFFLLLGGQNGTNDHAMDGDSDAEGRMFLLRSDFSLSFSVFSGPRPRRLGPPARA